MCERRRQSLPVLLAVGAVVAFATGCGDGGNAAVSEGGGGQGSSSPAACFVSSLTHPEDLFTATDQSEREGLDLYASLVSERYYDAAPAAVQRDLGVVERAVRQGLTGDLSDDDRGTAMAAVARIRGWGAEAGRCDP